jgi:uncharacterized LabA/DUF88 family protein
MDQTPQTPPKVFVYIDGFNFFHGSLQDRAHRWLNLDALCRAASPEYDIKGIRYFTAIVKPTASDPQKQTRQYVYIRALETIPHLRITYGEFRDRKKTIAVYHRDCGKKFEHTFTVSKEKGSDANLATELLVDAFYNRYERAIVMTGDSDLAAPVRAVRTVFKKPVTVINPQGHESSART